MTMTAISSLAETKAHLSELVARVGEQPTHLFFGPSFF
jgi:hypothetical protein